MAKEDVWNRLKIETGFVRMLRWLFFRCGSSHWPAGLCVCVAKEYAQLSVWRARQRRIRNVIYFLHFVHLNAHARHSCSRRRGGPFAGERRVQVPGRITAAEQDGHIGERGEQNGTIFKGFPYDLCALRSFFLFSLAMRCLVERVRFYPPFAAHADVAHSFIVRSVCSFFVSAFESFFFLFSLRCVVVSVRRRVCANACWLRRIAPSFRSNVNSSTSSSILLEPICSFIYWIEWARFDTLVHSLVLGSPSLQRARRRRWTNNKKINNKTMVSCFVAHSRQILSFSVGAFSLLPRMSHARACLCVIVTLPLCAANTLDLRWRPEKLMIARRESNCTELFSVNLHMTLKYHNG